jgi:hypothetical protein
MTTDLLGDTIVDHEAAILEVYTRLKQLLSDGQLPPFAIANLQDALASTSIVVTGLALDDERIIDLGC